MYRLDVCELLSRMINDEINIPQESSIRKHLEDFVKHFTSSLTKALKKTPVLYIEVTPLSYLPYNKLLFSKLPPTIYYLQHGEELSTQPKRPRAAVELEVRPGRNREDQIAVVVASLLDDQKSEALDTMKTIFANAITEMRSWELAAEARRIINREEETGSEGPRRQSTGTRTFFLQLI